MLIFPTTTGKKYPRVHDANQTSYTFNTQEGSVVFTFTTQCITEK